MMWRALSKLAQTRLERVAIRRREAFEVGNRQPPVLFEQVQYLRR